MANEPPCWVLDEHYKDTGMRDYSKCNPMCCTTTCELVVSQQQNWLHLNENLRPEKARLATDLVELLNRDVTVRFVLSEFVKAVLKEKPELKKE